MKDIRALQVVAYGADDKPITVAPSCWSASIDLAAKKLTLSFRGNGVFPAQRLTRPLSEVGLLHMVNTREEVAVAKTAGRMLLTGVATGLLFQGKGKGGAVADLVVRGTEKRGLVTAQLAFYDTTVVEFEATEEEFQQLSKVVPYGKEAGRELTNFFEVIERRVQDGRRSLDELERENQGLEEKKKEISQKIERGSSFEERDQLRRELEECDTQIAFNSLLKRTVNFLMAYKNAESEGRLDEKTRPLVDSAKLVKLSLFVAVIVAGVVIAYGPFIAKDKEKEAQYGPSPTPSYPSEDPVRVVPSAPPVTSVPNPVAEQPPVPQPDNTPALPTAAGNRQGNEGVGSPPVAVTPPAQSRDTQVDPMERAARDMAEQLLKAAPTSVPSPASPEKKPETSAAQPSPVASKEATKTGSSKSIDDQYNDRADKECGRGFPALICRESLKVQLCNGKWAENPPEGQSLCKRVQSAMQ
jgi:hypothetical protein